MARPRAGDAALSKGETLDIFAEDGPFEENPTTVLFDLSPLRLDLPAGEHFLRIAVSGEGIGNNAGLTSIEIGAATGGSSGVGFTITRAVRAEVEGKSVLELQWNSATGATYGLDSSTNLETWIDDQGGIESGGKRTTLLFDTDFCSDFYLRIRRE